MDEGKKESSQPVYIIGSQSTYEEYEIKAKMKRSFNHWIDYRERFIAFLLGYDDTFVLNVHGRSDHQGEIPGAELAGDLKQAINGFKSMAIDASGYHVDYVSLADSDVYQMYRDDHSSRLRNFDPRELTNDDQKLAFWINLYNALILDAVISYRVRVSVTEGFLGVLSFFKRAAYAIGGIRTTADDIEHGILRRNRGNPYIPGLQFGPDDPRLEWMVSEVDPRIHFALNCASRSCPPIGVYSADQIDRQLDIAASNFINQEVELDPESATLTTSKIFHWYRRDFGGKQGLIAFIHGYLDEDRQNWLTKNLSRTNIRYKPYGWVLNV